MPGLDEVVDDLDGPEDRPADAAGEADDLAAPVADGADAMERALDAGAVVVAEGADVVDDVLQVGLDDLALEEHGLAAAAEASLRAPAEVHHDLDQVALRRQGLQGGDELGRQGGEQSVEVVGHLAELGASARARGRSRLIAPSCIGRLVYRLVHRGSFIGWPAPWPAPRLAPASPSSSSVTVAMRSKPASSSRPSIGAS